MPERGLQVCGRAEVKVCGCAGVRAQGFELLKDFRCVAVQEYRCSCAGQPVQVCSCCHGPGRAEGLREGGTARLALLAGQDPAALPGVAG